VLQSTYPLATTNLGEKNLCPKNADHIYTPVPRSLTKNELDQILRGNSAQIFKTFLSLTKIKNDQILRENSARFSKYSKSVQYRTMNSYILGTKRSHENGIPRISLCQPVKVVNS
jgi:hypothetical protein